MELGTNTYVLLLFQYQELVLRNRFQEKISKFNEFLSEKIDKIYYRITRTIQELFICLYKLQLLQQYSIFDLDGIIIFGIKVDTIRQDMSETLKKMFSSEIVRKIRTDTNYQQIYIRMTHFVRAIFFIRNPLKLFKIHSKINFRSKIPKQMFYFQLQRMVSAWKNYKKSLPCPAYLQNNLSK